MPLATVDGHYHNATSGTATSLSITGITVPTGSRMSISVFIKSGSVGSPFALSDVTFDGVSAVRKYSLQLWSWKVEVWVVDAPSAGTTAVISSASSVKMAAWVHVYADARSLLSSDNLRVLGSTRSISVATESTAFVKQPDTPTTAPTFLGVNLVASDTNNQTFAPVSPNVEIADDSSVATTDVHMAYGSTTVPLSSSGGLGTLGESWTFGTACDWAGLFLVVRGGAAAPSTGPLTQVGTREYVAPAASSPSSVTPSGTIWGNSAWVQLVASTDTDWLLTALHAVEPGIPLFTERVRVEVDLALGASGSETVFATFRGTFNNEGGVERCTWKVRRPLDAIPAGSRIAVRMRQNVTNVSPVWKFAISYLKKSSSSGIYAFTSTGIIKCAPSMGALIVIAANAGVGPNWVSSAWYEAAASTSVAWELLGVTPSAMRGHFEVDVGIGAAGSEVVVATISGNFAGSFIGCPIVYECWPVVDAIPAGVRVAARMRSDDVISAGTYELALLYQEKA